MNLVQHLARQAEMRPDAPALIEGCGRQRRVCTFAALDARSARMAERLHAGGLVPGDTVLVAEPFSARLYVVLAAVFRAGLVAIVPDPSADRERLAECCRRCPPDGFIGPAKAHLLRVLVSEVRVIANAFVTGCWPVPGAARLRPEHGKAIPIVPRYDDAPALLTFTSGSTGAPKAVARTHGLLGDQYRALRDNLNLHPDQKDFTTLPIFALANLAAGVTSVLPDADLRAPGRCDSASVLEQIRAEQPDRLAASPAFAQRLLEAENGADVLAKLERIDLGGAPVSPALLQRLRDDAPAGAERVAVYGSTEAEPIAHVAARHVRPANRAATCNGRGLLAGRPVEEVDVRILPDRWGAPVGPFSEETFQKETLPDGEAGEIVVHGPHVVPGYLDGHGEAEAKLEVNGTRWHRTGDAGRFDDEGQLWLLGRCGAKVSEGGSACGPTCYPLQITSAARALAGVRQAAFTSCRGQRVLVVEPHCTGTAPDALRALLHEHLAWAGLDAVRFTDVLPTDRRHNAKVNYPALRRLLDDAFEEPTPA